MRAVAECPGECRTVLLSPRRSIPGLRALGSLSRFPPSRGQLRTCGACHLVSSDSCERHFLILICMVLVSIAFTLLFITPPHPHPPLASPLLAFTVILTSVFYFLKFAGFHFCHSLFRSAFFFFFFKTFLFTFGVFQSFKFLLPESVVLVHSFFPQSNVHVRTCTRSVTHSHTNNETETKTPPPPITPPLPPSVPTPYYDDLVEVLLYVHRNCRIIKDGSPGRPPRLSHSS